MQGERKKERKNCKTEIGIELKMGTKAEMEERQERRRKSVWEPSTLIRLQCRLRKRKEIRWGNEALRVKYRQAFVNCISLRSTIFYHPPKLNIDPGRVSK